MTFQQRPKGIIKCYVAWVCLCMGLCTTHATTISTYARVGVWDGLTRHLRNLNCPKCGFPARNCLCGHLGHVDRNAYAWAHDMRLSPKCLWQLTTPRVLLTPDSHRQVFLNTWREVLDPIQLGVVVSQLFQTVFVEVSDSGEICSTSLIKVEFPIIGNPWRRHHRYHWMLPLVLPWGLDVKTPEIASGLSWLCNFWHTKPGWNYTRV